MQSLESGQPIHFWFRTPVVLVIFSLLMLLALAMIAVGKYVFWVSSKYLFKIIPFGCCSVTCTNSFEYLLFENIELNWILRKNWMMWKIQYATGWYNMNLQWQIKALNIRNKCYKSSDRSLSHLCPVTLKSQRQIFYWHFGGMKFR